MKKRVTPRRCSDLKELRCWARRSRVIGNILLVLIGEYGIIMSLIGAFQSRTVHYGDLAQEVLEFCPLLLVSSLFRYTILFLAAYLLLRLLPVFLEGIAAVLSVRRNQRKKNKAE